MLPHLLHPLLLALARRVGVADPVLLIEGRLLRLVEGLLEGRLARSTECWLPIGGMPRLCVSAIELIDLLERQTLDLVDEEEGVNLRIVNGE